MTYNPTPTDEDIDLNKPLYKAKNWYLIIKENLQRHKDHPGNSMIVHKCPSKTSWLDKRTTIAYTNHGYSSFSSFPWCVFCKTSPEDDLKTLWALHNADIISMFNDNQ